MILVFLVICVAAGLGFMLYLSMYSRRRRGDMELHELDERDTIRGFAPPDGNRLTFG
jgi:hypothetical protein